MTNSLPECRNAVAATLLLVHALALVSPHCTTVCSVDILCDLWQVMEGASVLHCARLCTDIWVSSEEARLGTRRVSVHLEKQDT